MRLWGRALVCGLLGWSTACDDLGEHFEYRGGRLLDEGDYHVAAAHWLDTLPVVFASRKEGPDGQRVLRFVPLSNVGIEPCSTMAGTGFIAVGREGAFRMAVINDSDRDRKLDFFDASCSPVGPAFDDAVEIDYIADFQFLVRTLDGSAYIVEPFEGRVEVIGRNVLSVGLPSTETRDLVENPPPLAVWILDEEGLQLRDMRGRALTKTIPGATRLSMYRGPTAGVVGTMAYSDADGVHIVNYDLRIPRGDDGLVELSEQWLAEGACGQNFNDIDDLGMLECDSSDCELAPDPASMLSSGRHAWVAMWQPCDARRLVLRRVLDSVTFVVDERVSRYRVSSRAAPEGPVTFYRRSDADGARDLYRAGTGEPIAIEVPVDLGLIVEDADSFPRVRMTTAEDSPRFGTWHPDTGFESLREGVWGTRETSMVLHDYDPATGIGTLSLCEDSCFTVAANVRRGGYRKYTALERIGDGPIVLAYIHDYQVVQGRSSGSGTLTVVNTESGLLVDIDDDVSSFAPIENGPARGIVYSVNDPERQGLWFAPR